VTSIRRGGVPPRGYLRSQLQPVWRRAWNSPPQQPDEPGEPGEPDDTSESTAGFAGFIDFAGFKETPTNGETRRCACGNALLAPAAIYSGSCKPCRDKLMAGYNS
jgi:hypothetical protein